MSMTSKRIFQTGQYKVGLKRLRALTIAALLAVGVTVLTPQTASAFICEPNPGGTSVLGATTDAGSVNNMACGTSAIASGAGSLNTATGNGADASGAGSSNTATGFLANASGDSSRNTASGRSANASGDNTSNVAFGANSVSTGGLSTAVGPTASAAFANSAAFGNTATATRVNQQIFGTATNTNTTPGITSGARGRHRAGDHRRKWQSGLGRRRAAGAGE